MQWRRSVLTVKVARMRFQPIQSLCPQEARVMRDSVDMDDIAAQFAARTFVRIVMFSYTMYYTSVLVAGCDRSCHPATFALHVWRTYVLSGIININDLMAFIWDGEMISPQEQSYLIQE